VSENHANGDARYIAGGGRCGSCLAPVGRGRDRCDKCKAYDAGYRDGMADMARVLLNESVAKAARLVDADVLAVELGGAIAEGETRAFDWPVSKR
jgi:hypothetical protein